MILNKIESAAIAAFDCQGRLLLGLRNDTGKYTTPGGHLNEGETPVQGAQRELREETGLGFLSLDYLGSEEVAPGKLVHAFQAIVNGTPDANHDPDQEVKLWEFFDVQNGLSQGIINNLHHANNVPLRLLGLLEPPPSAQGPDDIDALMSHADPFERQMALKLEGAGPKHLMAAFSSKYADLWEQALKHKKFNPEVMAHLMRLDNMFGPQRAALDHPCSNQVQTVRLLNTLKRQLEANPQDHAALRLMGHLFNNYQFSNDIINNTAIDKASPMPIRALLYSSPSIGDDLILNALKDGTHPEELRLAAIKNPKTPSEMIVDLLKNPNESNQVAMAACTCPRLSAEELDQLVFHSDLRGYHPQIKQFALMNPHIQQRHVDHVKNLIYGSDNIDPNFDNSLNKFLAKSGNDHVLADLLGVDAKLEELMAAAKFLCSHDPVLDIRTALFQNDGDLLAAVLCAYGLPVTDQNRMALIGIQELKALAKSEKPDLFNKEVKALLPEGIETALRLQDGLRDNNFQSIELNGKHIAGALLVTCQTGSDILLKPNSGKKGAAVGVDDEKASQAKREAAFYQVAKCWGLEGYLPHSDLVTIVEKEYAAIEMLNGDYVNLDVKRRQDPALVPKILFPYVNSGDVWKWALLDMVCGNADRHAGNMMSNSYDEVKLIDHGAAFASLNFSPGLDENTFIPYYLRFGCERGFNSLTQEEKMKYMPLASRPISEALKNWTLSLSIADLQEILPRYGIDPTASVSRLAALHLLAQSMDVDQALAQMWCGLISVAFES